MKRFLVMMRNSWGVGDTLQEADARARREGNHGRRKTMRFVWTFDPAKTETAYIDEYGSLCWSQGGERPVRSEELCGMFGPERTTRNGEVTS